LAGCAFNRWKIAENGQHNANVSDLGQVGNKGITSGHRHGGVALQGGGGGQGGAVDGNLVAAQCPLGALHLHGQRQRGGVTRKRGQNGETCYCQRTESGKWKRKHPGLVLNQ